MFTALKKNKTWTIHKRHKNKQTRKNKRTDKSAGSACRENVTDSTYLMSS